MPKKLSIGQRKTLAEFFTNSAVAWLTAGVITPFFLNKTFEGFFSYGFWGLALTTLSLVLSLFIMKGIKS